MGFAAREARIANEFGNDIEATDSDYVMSAGSTCLFVDPATAFVDITLPSVNEGIGQMYSIANTNTTGNVVRVVDKEDSTGFTPPEDLPNGCTYVFYSNGVQWLLMFSNVPVIP